MLLFLFLVSKADPKNLNIGVAIETVQIAPIPFVHAQNIKVKVCHKIFSKAEFILISSWVN